MKKILTMWRQIGAQNLKSQEPRAKSQEPRAKSQEPRAKSQEPRAKSQEPRAKSQEPRAKSTGVSSRLAHPAGRRSDSWRRLLAKLSGQPAPGSVPSPSRAQSLSRPDRRSLRAFTVAALACAALMGFSATAQAQTEVWSATLTVKELSPNSSTFGCTNTTSSVRCSDFLSEDEFTYDSTDYAITAIFLTRNAQLQLHFDTDLTTAAQTLTLDVAGTTFAFEAAHVKGAAQRSWSRSGLSWSADDAVALKLTETPATTNNAPVFTEGTSTTRSVAENTAASTNIGTAIAATDADSGDTLEYTLGGTDMASFAIVSTSGQLQTRAALDFETKSSYAVTVSVSDGNGGTDSIGVTITVTDVNEQPGRPAAPSVGATANSDTSLDVSWTAPGLNGGPAITGYHLQYRQGTSGTLHERPAERQRHERDDHGSDCGHVVSGAGARAERRNTQRLVACGNRQQLEFAGDRPDTHPRRCSHSLRRGRRQRPDLCGTERAQHSTHHGSGGHRGRHGDGAGRLRRA